MIDDFRQPAQAHALACQLISPLAGKVPNGYLVDVREEGHRIVIAAHQHNRGAIIGCLGAMVRSLQCIMAQFGWTLKMVDQTSKPMQSPILEPWGALQTVERILTSLAPLEHQRGLVHEAGHDLMTVWLHPRFGPDVAHDLGCALDTWAYPVAKVTTGTPLKIAVMLGGILEDEAAKATPRHEHQHHPAKQTA